MNRPKNQTFATSGSVPFYTRIARLFPLALLAMCPPLGAQNVLEPLSETALAALDFIGPVDLRPHVRYRIASITGLRAGPGIQTDTIVHTFIPSVTAKFGDNWTLIYTPRITRYSNRSFTNNVDNDLQFNGSLNAGEWRLRLIHRRTESSVTRVETASQTDQTNSVTNIQAIRPLGSRLNIELSVARNERSVDVFAESRSLSTTNWLRYSFSDRLSAAVGLGVGSVDVSTGSDMTFTRLNMALGWRIGTKLRLQVNGGTEERSIRGSSGEKLNRPIMTVSATYKPFETTELGLRSLRSVDTSYFRDQVTEKSELAITLRQRLLGRIRGELGYRRYSVSYIAAIDGVSAGREDDYRTYSGRLSTSLYKRLTCAVFVQESKNITNVIGYDFSSSQYGLELGYRY